jgi:hypothetical protein
MSLQEPLQAHCNDIVIRKIRGMSECERTANGECEWTLGEGFLRKVVTLPRAIMALEAWIGDVSASPTMSGKASHSEELASLGVRENTRTAGVWRAAVIHTCGVHPVKIHIGRLDWVPPSCLLRTK